MCIRSMPKVEGLYVYQAHAKGGESVYQAHAKGGGSVCISGPCQSGLNQGLHAKLKEPTGVGSRGVWNSHSHAHENVMTAWL